ncbi:MAG: LPS export ABC transporter permease LptG [Bdellovibrionales bacterium]
MMRAWTLPRYLGRQYAFWFLAFFFGLSGIIYLFEVAELMRRTAALDNTSLGLILRMAFYKMPDTISKIMPFVVLFSGMFTFWKLTRSQELIIARSAGVSAWQFLAPALLVTLLFSLLNVTLLNPIGAVMTSQYQALESHYLKGTPSLELTGAGLWLRQNNSERHYLIHADQVSLSPLALSPVIIFIYDAQDTYLGRIDATKAVLKGKTWIASKAWFNWNDETTEYRDEFHLETNLTLEKIQESMASPNTISFWHLPRFIRALKSIGLPPARHELKLQMLLSEPVLLCAMVFFAAAFSLRLNRHGGILNAMMAGMFVGSVIYSLNNVVTALGANQTLPVLLAAWIIPLLALIGGQATLLYLEDG